MNERLMKAAEEAINRLFCDKSVSPEVAISNLEELAADIEMKLDALNTDLHR